MVLLFGLGLWLVWNPNPAIKPDPGTQVQTLQLGPIKGVVEVSRAEEGGPARARVLYRDGSASQPISAAEFERTFGVSLDRVAARPSTPLFRLLNITSWGSLLWVAIGFAGQAAMFGRMAIQWVVSEKQKQSVIPEAFWWLSLVGGISLFSYFAWRQDLIAVLGQTSGVVIYARNIRLIHKQRRRAARAAQRLENGDTVDLGGGDSPLEPAAAAEPKPARPHIPSPVEIVRT
ncbi:MAG: lipid-A-disaccharide synthase N-terminal domain-containing protein [Phycisphaerales bacterium]|nr:lipid-A-disaccharide synthase N-terminal domain-containing protein [Phycisphaerales bacterium]